MDEQMDMADHLIAAAKQGMRDGLTKEQFQANAEVFWDSWARFKDFADQATQAGR